MAQMTTGLCFLSREVAKGQRTTCRGKTAALHPALAHTRPQLHSNHREPSHRHTKALTNLGIGGTAPGAGLRKWARVKAAGTRTDTGPVTPTEAVVSTLGKMMAPALPTSQGHKLAWEEAGTSSYQTKRPMSRLMGLSYLLLILNTEKDSVILGMFK